MFFGLFLWLAQAFILWPLQIYVNTMRPPPFQEQYAFPSIEGFYVAALVTVIIVRHALWGWRIGKSMWLMCIFSVASVSIILAFFRLNVWWQVLMSMILGADVAFIYIWLEWLFMRHAIVSLQFFPPLSWLGFDTNMTWCASDPRLLYELYQNRQMARRLMKKKT
jgi:hypothetical protein